MLERDEPGAGASGVAAGMLAPVGEASWGEDALIRLATASARAWPPFAAELAADSGLEPGYEACGALHVALDRDEAGELQRRFELMGSLEPGSSGSLPRAAGTWSRGSRRAARRASTPPARRRSTRGL